MGTFGDFFIIICHQTMFQIHGGLYWHIKWKLRVCVWEKVEEVWNTALSFL